MRARASICTRFRWRLPADPPTDQPTNPPTDLPAYPLLHPPAHSPTHTLQRRQLWPRSLLIAISPKPPHPPHTHRSHPSPDNTRTPPHTHCLQIAHCERADRACMGMRRLPCNEPVAELARRAAADLRLYWRVATGPRTRKLRLEHPMSGRGAAPIVTVKCTGCCNLRVCHPVGELRIAAYPVADTLFPGERREDANVGGQPSLHAPPQKTTEKGRGHDQTTRPRELALAKPLEGASLGRRATTWSGGPRPARRRAPARRAVARRHRRRSLNLLNPPCGGRPPAQTPCGRGEAAARGFAPGGRSSVSGCGSQGLSLTTCSSGACPPAAISRCLSAASRACLAARRHALPLRGARHKGVSCPALGAPPTTPSQWRRALAPPLCPRSRAATETRAALGLPCGSAPQWLTMAADLRSWITASRSGRGNTRQAMVQAFPSSAPPPTSQTKSSGRVRCSQQPRLPDGATFLGEAGVGRRSEVL